MSGNTFTCRDRYFNYGSYLRSRGYDKEICNLIVAIEQGQFPIGPIYPGNCSKRITTTIKGNVDIVPCEVTDNKPDATPPTPISGQLTVTGGYIGAGGIDVSNGTNIPTLVAQQALGFGIQSLTGISSNGGPIYQQTDCSHSNWFGAKDHLFVGGVGDCSTNVFVRGNLFVDGNTVELNGFIGETLSLVTLPGNAALGTLNTFKSPISNGNMVDMYTADISSVAALSGDNQWKNYLSFAIDGNSSYPQTDICGIDVSAGMSNVMGHMRGFRGLTITNPPSGGPVDIQWNPDISGTHRAIDAYGSIRVQPGNTGTPGNIDISGGQFTIFQNDISNIVLFSNGDASFNGRVSCYDLSVTNIATFGASTTYIDTSNVNTSYVTVDNSLNTKFIYTPSSNDMYINAGSGGTFSDIYMNANNIFMDSDLSVNDISSSNINNTGLINTNSITAQSMTIDDISTNHISVYDLSVTNFLVVDGDISANGAISGVSFTDGIATLSAGALSNALTIQATSGEFTDISVNTHASIYDLSVVNMHTVGTSTTTIDTNSIQANSGEFIDISVNNIIQAENFIGCNLDISAGRAVSAPLGDFGYIQQTESTGSIKTYQISSWPSSNIDISAGSGNVIFKHTNNVIMSNSDLSAGDISANNIQANSGEFIDISVNSHASIYDLSVGNITINNTGLIETYDLSVNNHAYIYDLSVNGDSVFTGNFLINNITGGSEAITIQTNQGTNEKITIQTLQGQSSDSININSTAGGVNISAGTDITFSASDIIMSSSDLSAGDISANIIQAANFILNDGNTFIDLSSTVSSLNTYVNVLDISVNGLETTILNYDTSFNSNLIVGASGEFTDISVNNHASIFDLSVTGQLDVSGTGINFTNGYIGISQDTTTGPIRIGNAAGQTTQGDYSVAIGSSAGNTGQGNSSVAIGDDAANSGQGEFSNAIGYQAANSGQGQASVAIGSLAGRTSQGDSSVAMGNRAGYTSQGQFSVAIGNQAGETNQGQYSVAIGYKTVCQDNSSVALGSGATTTANNQIVLGTATETVWIPGDLSANNVTDLSNNVTDLRTTVTDLSSTVTDLSNNVTLLDASVNQLDVSMAIVEKVASLRYRAVSSSVSYNSGLNYDNIKSFDTIDISNNMSMNISGLPANKGKISIPHTGIYSYNLQLACTTNNTVTFIDLAINNNSVNSPVGPSNLNIAIAGSTGGVNRRYDETLDFITGSTNTISLSGISKFNFGDEVQSYIKVSGGGSVTLDSANESIFSMALLYATD